MSCMVCMLCYRLNFKLLSGMLTSLTVFSEIPNESFIGRNQMNAAVAQENYGILN